MAYEPSELDIHTEKTGYQRRRHEHQRNEGNPFLTSDQPVINLKADYHTVTEEIDGIVFYYPITPNLAILVNSDYLNDEYNVTETEVDKYNRAVIAASNEFIFSNTVTAIKRYHEEKY